MASELGQVASGGCGGDGTGKDVAAGQTPLQHALPEPGAVFTERSEIEQSQMGRQTYLAPFDRAS